MAPKNSSAKSNAAAEAEDDDERQYGHGPLSKEELEAKYAGLACGKCLRAEQTPGTHIDLGIIPKRLPSTSCICHCSIP